MTNTHHNERSWVRSHGREMFVAALALFVVFAVNASRHGAFRSTEVRFTDSLVNDLSIIPASCPSYPHYAGGCSAPTCTLTLTPSTIGYGSSATLTWSSTYANSFYITGVGYVAASGSISVSPGSSTTYSGTVSRTFADARGRNKDAKKNLFTLRSVFGAATVFAYSQASYYAQSSYYSQGSYVTSASGTCSATLTVTPPSSLTATIAATSSIITLGASTGIYAHFVPGSGDTLTADNIDSPIGTGLGGNTNPDAYKYYYFTPSSAGTFTFYARATTQYYTPWATYASINVTVNLAPACTVSVSPSSIAQGQSSTLSYSSANATTFSISNIGSIPPNTSGSVSVAPSQPTDYTGSATAGGVTNTCPATLSVSCTPAYSCSGQTIQYTNASCAVSNIATCVSPAFCSAGSSICLYPPPQFNQSGSGSNALSGHLQANPQVLKAGTSATVTWNVSYVNSCSVTGTNGDSWTGTSGTHASSPILQQTIYTLHCAAQDGSTINESATVNVLPKFQER